MFHRQTHIDDSFHGRNKTKKKIQPKCRAGKSDATFNVSRKLKCFIFEIQFNHLYVFKSRFSLEIDFNYISKNV